MKDWLLTAALAAAALVAFYTLFVNPGAPGEAPVSRPVTTEGGPNGYLGMVRWLHSQKIEPLPLRDRFTALPRLAGVPASGNLLITTTPHRYPLRNSEFAPLRRWIEAGNTLLLVAGLSDTPEWSAPGLADGAHLSNVRRMTGLDFEVTRDAFADAGTTADTAVPAGTEDPLPAATDAGNARNAASHADESESDNVTSDSTSPATDTAVPEDSAAPPNDDAAAANTDAAAAPDAAGEEAAAGTAQRDPILRKVLANQRLPQPKELEMQPVESHELLAGVDSVRAVSEYPSHSWIALPNQTPLALELATSPQADAPVLWLARAGRGQMLISGFGSIFTNKLLGRDDNAQLLANIVQWSLAGEGRVIIDDAHQGEVAFYDPQAFFKDPRLHRTLWCVLGLWLVFVLGPQRLRITPRHWSPADLTSFVRATGGFMARVIKPAAAARRMFELFFAEVHQRTGLPVEPAPPWAWLEAHAGIADADLARLKTLHFAAQANRRVNLQQLHDLLLRARGSWLEH